MKTKLLLSICVLSSVIAYSQDATTSMTMGQTFRDYIVKAENGVNTQTATNFGTMKTLSYTEETQGSPFLCNTWVAGKIILRNRTILPEPEKILNYDKMRNVLLVKLSADNSKILNVNMDDVNSFILEDSGTTYKFTRLPEKSYVFMMELYVDSTYAVYKTVDTKFYKSDYVNKGYYESGYKYDRYIDENTYYLKPKNGELLLINNTKKELKKMRDAYPAAKQALALIPVASS